MYLRYLSSKLQSKLTAYLINFLIVCLIIVVGEFSFQNKVFSQNRSYLSSFWMFVILPKAHINASNWKFSKFYQTIKRSTSIEPHDHTQIIDDNQIFHYPWFFALDKDLLVRDNVLKNQVVRWLLSGGTLILESNSSPQQLAKLVNHSYFASDQNTTQQYLSLDKKNFSYADTDTDTDTDTKKALNLLTNTDDLSHSNQKNKPKNSAPDKNLSSSQIKRLTTKSLGYWSYFSLDHPLRKSFFLIEKLPECDQHRWYQYYYDNRTMIIVIPEGMLEAISDNPSGSKCYSFLDSSSFLTSSSQVIVRSMINLIMMLLTSDYKSDQIHLSEILKRMR